MRPIIFFYTVSGEKQVVALGEFGKAENNVIPDKSFWDYLFKKHPEYKKENLYLWYQNTSFLLVTADSSHDIFKGMSFDGPAVSESEYMQHYREYVRRTSSNQ